MNDDWYLAEMSLGHNPAESSLASAPTNTWELWQYFHGVCIEGLPGRLYIWSLDLSLNASFPHAVSKVHDITALHQGTQSAADNAGEMQLRTEMTGYITALESQF